MTERARKSLHDQIESELVFVRMLLGEYYVIDFVEDPAAKPEINLSALELNLANILSIREPLSSAVQTIEASWEEWSALIKKINVNGEREAEVAAYRAYSTTSNLKDISASVLFWIKLKLRKQSYISIVYSRGYNCETTWD
jgi:hypothetical protein